MLRNLRGSLFLQILPATLKIKIRECDHFLSRWPFSQKFIHEKLQDGQTLKNFAPQKFPNIQYPYIRNIHTDVYHERLTT